MCTIGVIRFDDGAYALFKNKDFGRPVFDDRIVVEPSTFGVVGLATWDGTDPDLDEFSGFSIGANEHGVLCCDANVRAMPNRTSYDDLVEIALRKGTDAASAVEAVTEAVGRRPYEWGNLVLIDSDTMVAIEVRGDHLDITTSDRMIARTNHHVVLGATPIDDNTTTSKRRYDGAQRRLDAVVSVADLHDLLRSHDDGPTGICAHGSHETVYSYVLHRAHDALEISVVQGSPCRTAPPAVVPVPIGTSWSRDAEERFRRAYPSDRSAGSD